MMRTLTLAAIVLLGTNAYAQVQVQTARARVPSVPLEDEFFAMKAYAEGIAEVACSRLAMERATQPAIREFAEKMAREHTECNNKIVELCRTKGIALPAAIDSIHTAALNHLAAMSGSDFDKAYMKAQVCAHKAAIFCFEHEACKGEDQDVKKLASDALPTLQDHAKQAFDLAGEKDDYKKFCKIQDYAKQVMNEK
jgi:putative membrane protein